MKKLTEKQIIDIKVCYSGNELAMYGGSTKSMYLNNYSISPLTEYINYVVILAKGIFLFLFIST